MSAPAGTRAWPWLPFRQPAPGRTTVFCVPYAGGGASVYRPWMDLADPTLQICPVQLPGREDRLRESAWRRMDDLIPALAHALAPHLHQPFMLFGHSMGASIAFELALYLQQQAASAQPVHLVLSARRPPDEPAPRRPLHALPDDEFIDELRRLQGTPEAVLREPELMALLMPLLRADFELIETHHRPPGAGLNLPCTILGGLQDELAPDSLRGWSRHLKAAPELVMMDGGHFFLHKQRQSLLALMARIATQASSTSTAPRGLL